MLAEATLKYFRVLLSLRDSGRGRRPAGVPPIYTDARTFYRTLECQVELGRVFKRPLKYYRGYLKIL